MRIDFVRCGLWGANDRKEKFAMTYYDTQQQGSMHNPQFNPQQWAMFSPQGGQPYGAWVGGLQAIGPQGMGFGHAAYGQHGYGQQHGQFGAQSPMGGFGHNAGWAAQPQWWGQQHRQLSHQDVSEVVRQLLPALPQILAQAQQPQLGYAAYGQGLYGQAPYGQGPRTLSQQDVNEVVRQILPAMPQILGALQGQPQLQYAALHGGPGAWGQGGGWPQFQAAFGTPQYGGQRQLTQQDVADVTRQLVGLIPQVIGNLQAFNQQRMI
jgi:hypothetical protein